MKTVTRFQEYRVFWSQLNGDVDMFYFIFVKWIRAIVSIHFSTINVLVSYLSITIMTCYQEVGVLYLSSERIGGLSWPGVKNNFFKVWRQRRRLTIISRYVGTSSVWDRLSGVGCLIWRSFWLDTITMNMSCLFLFSSYFQHIFGCDACHWYTLIRLGDIMWYSGFVNL